MHVQSFVRSALIKHTQALLLTQYVNAFAIWLAAWCSRSDNSNSSSGVQEVSTDFWARCLLWEQTCTNEQTYRLVAAISHC